MRVRPVFHWLLLSVNLLLFLFLSHRAVQPVDPAAARAQSDGAKLGLELYVVKDPFACFVHKTFPKDGSFTLLDYREPVFLSTRVVETTKSGELKEVTVGLGTSYSLSFQYTATDKPAVREMAMTNALDDSAEAFFDLNADGTYDAHLLRGQQGRATRLFIWCEGGWQQVQSIDDDPKQDKYHKRLTSGRSVAFDMPTGRWHVLDDKPAAGPGKTEGKNPKPAH
jgi:hypothetical protein